ncbi:unnamed protein product [Rhizoctonia solani]|uniref:Uncharacterized protein n=1 Tax=Rhizoctonia solani TaxID=456999 RepID=A0A8H3HYH9_9AGAM|nr:unnamed protein product [Rhizoctonia solani]
MAPTVIESHLAPPLLDSTPATANESTWEALRVSSPIEFPESMNGTMSIYWRRKLMVMGDARRNNGRQINITEVGVVYPTPSTLPVIREESPNSQNLDTSTSTAPASCGNSTLLAAHELTEGSESSIGDTPGCSHIQMDSCDLEESPGIGSATTTTWVESMALRDTLSRPTTQNVILDATDGTKPPSMQDVGDLLPVKSFDHENAWANHDVENSEIPIDSAGVPLDSPDRENVNAYDYSECIERLCTCSGSSTSLGWMSQCSASTGLGSPLVTPSNSLPHLSQVDRPSTEEPHDVQSSCMDVIFESQLSQTGSSSPPQPGSPSMDTSRFDSVVQIASNGSSSADSDTVPAPKLSPESQMLQYFLDDRTYAEVAGSVFVMVWQVMWTSATPPLILVVISIVDGYVVIGPGLIGAICTAMTGSETCQIMLN